jgi:hypothetical protein
MGSGGARTGAGRKKKPLAEKLLFGNPGHETKDKLQPVIGCGTPTGKIPEISDYVKNASAQLGDTDTACRVFKETWEWIDEKGCLSCVKKELVEQYAVNVARWVWCVEKSNTYGLLLKSGQTASTHPAYKEEKDSAREVRELWTQILTTVNQNSVRLGQREAPHDDVMAKLLAED